tara:strand:- start:1286 stop:4228 length:2943 start_codon:yes stop_codon:yes gene_type:complete
MSVKNFKFVSPGVFINEIDNSFVPKSADAIGPVVVGRAPRGIAMEPVKVSSYSEFVQNFGDTVAGGGSGDVYRDGNYQSPMYGIYAAKAFLRSNVAPLTYVRVLGHQDTNNDGTDAAKAGWKTDQSLSPTLEGGAYGLFIVPSSSMVNLLTEVGYTTAGTTPPTASLAAVFYADSGSVKLKGAHATTGSVGTDVNPLNIVHKNGTLVESDASGNFKIQIASKAATGSFSISLDDNAQNYIRKVLNTNPQLTTGYNEFYPSSSIESYWLGETYDQETRDTVSNNFSQKMIGFIGVIAKSGSTSSTLADLKGTASREATAGWFVGQDLGEATDFHPQDKAQKLFRLRGRGHGEWLNKNAKVMITSIRQSNNSTTDYGTFSVVIRAMSDSDNAIQVIERFDNCTLDPSSPNFLARKIGDKFKKFSVTERRIKEYGEYPNNSKFVYVEMNSDVEAGATDALLLPFGYYGPPKISDIPAIDVGPAGTPATDGVLANKYLITAGTGMDGIFSQALSASTFVVGANRHVKLRYPDIRLRLSSSDGGLSDVTKASFGISTTRTAATNRFDLSTKMVNRLLENGVGDNYDPTVSASAGIDGFAYIMTLDDVVRPSTTSATVFYRSGSRNDESSVTAGGTYKTLLDLGYDSFTAPFWGGFDGFDIKLPDPLYNKGMTASSNNENNSIFYSLKRAIDSVADPEQVDMNLLAAPGVTNNSLTEHMIDVCESRADAMALIDLPDVYLPSHEIYYSDKSSRVATTPQAAATALSDRKIDSSYGATFYPWVQTRDDNTSQLVWVPPTVAMMGVLASSERKSQLWFAPAGFNRGGLSDGAAGIPVTNVTEKLTSKERDTLYDAGINPIASFPSTGIVVFGQKTLQETSSALDRINVRRLVIYLKKQISIISSSILFEQNVQTTWNRFKGLVEPFLANVKSNFGIADYRLILDDSTTTPDLVDQNILYAKIMVKPARSIEFIAIDFVIASTGASFDD